MSNNSNDNKEKSNRELFLFTSDGRKAVLEYMRNLTPQVLVGSVWMVFAVRSIELSFSGKTIVFWFVTLTLSCLFCYLVMGSMIDFINKSTEHMQNKIKKIDGFKPCENPNNFKVWSKYLCTTLKLVFKSEKILFVEFILTILFLLTPTIAVLFLVAKQADDLYRSLLGG
ncbi:MAG: hypothetical protein LKF82_07000 [Acinetobacter populi]|jgi:hypothetical protein|uniref:hypothetical protein n=1 Tax=Acinetobacter populi TaxID=1582270 RepID=UPI0023570ECC|nr:hypothetical protein [Acinetobacter populi]MCH4247572.1 hypothetical protein [Acinetobacter populi]